MNETLDKTASKILETDSSGVPVGVVILLLILLLAALAFALYLQHKWVLKKEEQLRSTATYDDSRLMEALADVKAEVVVGFKSLEKTVDAFMKYKL